MRHQIPSIFSILYLLPALVVCQDKVPYSSAGGLGVARVSEVSTFTPEVLSTDGLKWEGEALTLRLANRVEREFIKINSPSGKPVYFGNRGSSIQFLFTGGEIFGFFLTSSRMSVIPTMRATAINPPTSPTAPNIENWTEFEAWMEEALRKNPSAAGHPFYRSLTILLPVSLAVMPHSDISDVIDLPEILSTSLKDGNLLVDYEVPQFRLKARLEIDTKVRPWKILQAWKNGEAVDLETNLRKAKLPPRIPIFVPTHTRVK